MFEEYKDLYKFTSKTADDHIEFYKTKESLSMSDLFALWKKLSQQAEAFNDHDWTSGWTNWHKNYQGFERHKMEAKFLIQSYLTNVLVELLDRIMKMFGKYLEKEESKKPPEETHDGLSDLIKQEVQRQVREEIASGKRKTKKNKKSRDLN